MLNRGLIREHSFISTLAYLCVDLIAIITSALLAHLIRFGNVDMPTIYRIAVVLGVTLALLIFPQARLYDSWRGHSLLEQVRALAMAWSAVLLVLVLMGFMLKVSTMISRQWFGFWAILGGAELVLGRTLGVGFLRTLRYRGRNQRRLLIVGTGVVAEQVIRKVKKHENTGWRCCRVVAVQKDNIPKQVMGVPVGTRLDRLSVLVERGGIDEVWICLPISEQKAVQEVRYWLRHSTVTQRLVPDLNTIRLVRHQVAEILEMPVLNLTDSPMHGFNRLLKAFEDRVLATLILLFITPLMLLLAVAIKLTSTGPIIYTQRRHGWDGRPIKIYKFRSMAIPSIPRDRFEQARLNDPRVTLVGRFLRQTSLDELPQFFNVIKGDMSIVGPRPHAVEHNEQYKERIEAYMQRHRVKPGITGWAQVQGWRGETDTLDKMRKRIEHDLYYIEHWSLWLDLKIIALTAFRGFVHTNAY